MGDKNQAPQAEKVATPAFQGSQYKFGDETKSKTYKEGDNIVTQWNPTTQEQQSYDYLQGQLPSMYQRATTPQDFTSSVNNWTKNQKDLVNRDYQDSLRYTKNAFVNSGQMGSSIALDKLKPLHESYMQSMQDIEANAPTYANNLRNNDLAYNSSLLENGVNGLNQFYNTGNQFNSNATNLSGFGNDWADKDFTNRLQSNSLYYDQAAKSYKMQQDAKQAAQANAMGWAKTAASVGFAPMTGGASLGFL